MKRILSFTLVLAMLVLCFGTLVSCELGGIFGGSDDDEKKESGFDDGKGTEDDPYEISSAKELKKLAKKINGDEYAEYVDKHYILTKDIDLDGAEWTPIGGLALYMTFSGVFDGNGYSISNFKITEVDKALYSVGLFGSVSGTVKNLTVNDFTIDVTAPKHLKVGGIVGESNDGAEIYGCYAYDADINVVTEHSATVGGIVGDAYMSTLTDCRSEVTINAESSLGDDNNLSFAINCGAFAGAISESVVKDCSALSDVRAAANTHGAKASAFAGNIRASELTGCVAEGSAEVYHTDFMKNENLLFSSGYVGGLAAETSSADFKKCSFEGSLKATGVGNFFVGGLVGWFDGAAFDCFSNASITLDAVGKVTNYFANGAYVGGIAGFVYAADIESCYSAGTIDARYADDRLFVGGLTGGVGNNGNADVKLKNCLTASDISAKLETDNENVTLYVGYYSADYSYFEIECCYYRSGQGFEAERNSVHEIPAEQQFDIPLLPVTTELLNAAFFYTDMLFWDINVWNLTSLNWYGGEYPSLYASKTVID